MSVLTLLEYLLLILVLALTRWRMEKMTCRRRACGGVVYFINSLWLGNVLRKIN